MALTVSAIVHLANTRHSSSCYANFGQRRTRIWKKKCTSTKIHTIGITSNMVSSGRFHIPHRFMFTFQKAQWKHQDHISHLALEQVFISVGCVLRFLFFFDIFYLPQMQAFICFCSFDCVCASCVCVCVTIVVALDCTVVPHWCDAVVLFSHRCRFMQNDRKSLMLGCLSGSNDTSWFGEASLLHGGSPISDGVISIADVSGLGGGCCQTAEKHFFLKCIFMLICITMFVFALINELQTASTMTSQGFHG